MAPKTRRLSHYASKSDIKKG